MSLVQFFRILWARRAIVALTTLVTMAAAIAVGLIMPPRYEANSRAMLEILKPDPVTGVGLAANSSKAYFASQTELIKDYQVVGKVVDDLGWANSGELGAAYAASGQQGQMDFRRWLAQRVIDNLQPKFVAGSPILEISYTSNTPEAAAAVANAVRKAYIDETLRQKRADASRTADFFRRQTDEISVKIAELEKRKTEFERANGIYVGDDEMDADARRLDALATTSEAVVQPSAAPVVSQADPAAGQLAQADAAIEAASKVYGPNHPELQRLREQRAAIAASARASRPTVIRPAQVAAGPSVAAQYERQQAKVLAQRGVVDQARKMGADLKVLRDQYAKSSARAAELTQQGQSEESGITPIGNAVTPQKPAWPNWPLLIFGSLALGFGLGLVVALLAEMLGMRVRGVEDLKIEGVPVLGAMGRAPTPARRWPWQRDEALTETGAG